MRRATRLIGGSIVGCATVAAIALVALGATAQGRASAATPSPPRELVVALSLGHPALQAGVVSGSSVVLARGFEVDLARLLARRLGIARVRLIDVRPPARLLATSTPSWHVALAGLTTPELVRTVAASVPYLPSGQAVVPRRGLERLRSLDDLRRLQLCARRASAGVATIAGLVRPERRPLLAHGDARLVQLVQTGACDAALVDAVDVGRVVAGRGALLGPIAVRVDRNPGLVVAVARNGPVALGDVDRVLRRLRADGSLAVLARRWLGIDPARLRPLAVR